MTKNLIDGVLEKQKEGMIQEIMKIYQKYPDICNELNELLNNIDRENENNNISS